MESIRRNTLFSLAVQMTGAVLSGALTLFLVRALGPEDYGIFALAIGVGTVLLLPSDFGISQSAARFIAERRHRHDEVGRILTDALSLKLLGSLLVSVALVALAGPIAAAYDEPALAWPIRFVAVAIFGQGLLGLFSGFFEAMGRNSLAFRLVLAESSVEVASSVGLVLLGTGAAGAAAGRAVGFAFGALVGVLLVMRLLGSGRLRVGVSESWGYRRIAGYAGAVLVIDGAFALFDQIDVLLIGAILGTQAAGLFAAPMKLMALLQYPGAALAGGVAPRLARGNEGPNVDAFQKGLRYLLLLQPLLAAPLLVWAEPIVDIALGSEYGESVDVLRALTPFALMFAAGTLLATGVNYLGEARRRIPLAIGAVALNAAIDLALLREIGIVAGALGTDAAMLLYVGGHVWILNSVVGLDLRGLGITFARTMLAFAVACGVLFAFGTGDVAIPLLIAGGALATIAYAGTLVATREVTRGELESVRGLLSRGRS